MSLSYIGEQLTIYIGSFLVIIGVLGNALNILIFSIYRDHNRAPCTFYFVISSIFNILYLLINLISRIVSLGTGIDLTRISSIWCRTRSFFLMTLCQITLSCSCLAIIDQYFVTSQNVRRRRLSNMKLAHRISLIVIIIWIIHGIVPFSLSGISSVGKGCVAITFGYYIYSNVYLLGLATSIPISIMILFGYLTYRNIKLTKTLAEHRTDRQLTRMVMLQVIFIALCISPYGIFYAYLLITSSIKKDSNRLSIENFIFLLVSLICYIYYSGSCYLFLMVSSRFRRTVKQQLVTCWKHNRVNPVK